jgi:hypothetical protein
MDSWFEFIPLELSALASILIIDKFLSWIVGSGGASRWPEPSRASHGAIRCFVLYLSGLHVAAIAILLLALVAPSLWGSPEPFRSVPDRGSQIALVVMAVAVCLHMNLSYVARFGRRPWLRGTVAICFPALAWLIWNIVSFAIYWFIGFVLLAIRSMTI